jgi:pimeloyl-ACP methyl ester carboxylesterase
MNARPASFTKPLVVCLHASGSSSRQWQPLADLAGRSLDIVAPDLYGHGRGPAWLGAPSGVVAGDAERVARLLSIDRRAHLVGHSYGGVVALKVALAFPERVRSVTVWEPVMFRALRDFAPRSREAIEAFAVGRAVQRDARGGLLSHAARRFVDYWSAPGAFDAMSEPRREAVVHRMATVAAHFASLWNDTMRMADVARSRVPLVVLSGARTVHPTRRIVELMRYARPDAAGGAMTMLGHMGPLTHPATVAQRIAFELAALEARESVIHELAA